MRYYKQVENDYLLSIGTGSGHEEITAEEYENILAIIKSRPTAEAGYGYRLKTDLTWELRELPPVTVYEPEYSPEDEAIANAAGVKETHIRKENGKYIVEGEWLYNFMGQINFSDYESLNFFQRVLSKNGVFDKLREAGIEEGDTVSIYDFEFDYVK